MNMNRLLLDQRFLSRDPLKIDKEIIEDLICRFLLNLPE